MKPIQNDLSKKLILFAATVICAIFMIAIGTPRFLHAQDNSQYQIFLPLISSLSQNKAYTIELDDSTAVVLPSDALDAMALSLNTWTKPAPVGNVFHLLGLRWEDSWGLATLTSDDPTQVKPDEQDGGANINDLFTMILVKTDSGWKAAIDGDSNLEQILVPLTDLQLSQEARQAFFPVSFHSYVSTDIEAAAVQQYTNYKFPWKAGELWEVTQGWHDGAYYGFPANYGLDFDISGAANSDILAAASGLVFDRINCTLQTVLVIQTEGTNEKLGYLHLDKQTVSANIKKGKSVSQGQKLGRMVNSDGPVIVDEKNCGKSIDTHLHIYAPVKPFTIDGVTFTASDAHYSSSAGPWMMSSQGSTGALPAAPSNLQATALDSTRIQLKWKDNSNNEAGFAIYDGSIFVVNAAANIVSYTVTGLAPGSYHCYHLFAYNNYGNSAWTDWGCAITTSGPTGFNSQFNGSAPGWWVDSGGWSVDANFLTSSGVANKWATIHQEGDYRNFDFETAVWRNGCDYCSSVVFFRGTPTPLNSINSWYKGYFLSFTRSGYFALLSTKTSTIYLQNWTFTSALNQGSAWNGVRIVAVGSSIKLYFNGVLVWSGTNTDHTTGKVGIGMYQEGSGNQVWFDYAKLTPITSAVSLEAVEVTGQQQALNQAANAENDSTGSGTAVKQSLPGKSLPNMTPPLATGLDMVNLPASGAELTVDVAKSTGETPLQGAASQRIYLPIIEGSEGNH